MNNAHPNGTQVNLVWRGKQTTGVIKSSTAHGSLVYYDVKLTDGYSATVNHDHVAVADQLKDPAQPELDLNTRDEPATQETKPVDKAKIETKPMPKGTQRKDQDHE